MPNELDEPFAEVLPVVASLTATVRGHCEGGIGGKAEEAEVEVVRGRPSNRRYDRKAARLEVRADRSAQSDAQDPLVSR